MTEQTPRPSRPLLITILCCLEILMVALFILLQFVPFSKNAAHQFYVAHYGMPTLTGIIMAVLDMASRLAFTLGYWKMRKWAVILNAVTLIIMIPYDLSTHPPEDILGYSLIEFSPIAIGIFYYRRMI